MTSKSTSKKIPNYNSEDDTHEKIIKEFWLYSHWQERFERFGYHGSGVQARRSLTRLKRLLTERYRELLKKSDEIHGNQNDDGFEAPDDN